MRKKKLYGLVAALLALTLLLGGCSVKGFMEGVVQQVAAQLPGSGKDLPRGSVLIDGQAVTQQEIVAHAGTWDALITPYYRQQLQGDQALIYDAILYAYEVGAPKVTLVGNFGLQPVLDTLDYVKTDWPFLYTSQDGNTRAAELWNGNVELELSAIDLSMVLLNQGAMVAAQAIVDGIPSEAQSDVEKARYLYDTLARRIHYNSGEGLQMADQPARWTAYGALVEGDAVCDGVTSAVQLVFQMAGIPCVKVYYDGADVGVRDGHAWNLVWLEDTPVYVDVHSAAQAMERLASDTQDGAAFVPLTYFAMTDQDLERAGRTLSPIITPYIPPCSEAPWASELYDVVLETGQEDQLVPQSMEALQGRLGGQPVCLQYWLADDATYEAVMEQWGEQGFGAIWQQLDSGGKMTLWEFDGGVQALQVIFIP